MLDLVLFIPVWLFVINTRSCFNFISRPEGLFITLHIKLGNDFWSWVLFCLGWAPWFLGVLFLGGMGAIGPPPSSLGIFSVLVPASSSGPASNPGFFLVPAGCLDNCLVIGLY